MSFAYIVHLANYSDGVLYVLAFLLLVATAVTLDRLWYLRRAILRGNALVHRMASMGRVTAGDLEELRNLAGRQPEAVLLDTALQHAGAASSDALGNRMDERPSWSSPRASTSSKP